MEKFYILLSIFCITLLGTIIELVRRKHLREKYALLWFLISFIMIIGFFNESLVSKVSLFIGIKYPPTLIFIAAITGLLLLNLMLSVIDSHQTDRIIKLAQKIAILEERLNRQDTKRSFSDKENSKDNNHSAHTL